MRSSRRRHSFAPRGSVSMEPYPTISSRLRHAILLPAAKTRRSFWLRLLWRAQVALWGEGLWRKKGWGQSSNQRLPSGLPFCYQICRDTKRATVSLPRASRGREKGGYRTAFPLGGLQSVLGSALKLSVSARNCCKAAAAPPAADLILRLKTSGSLG